MIYFFKMSLQGELALLVNSCFHGNPFNMLLSPDVGQNFHSLMLEVNGRPE